MTRDDLQSLRRQLIGELSARCKLIMAGDPPMSDIRDIQLEIAAIDDRIAGIAQRAPETPPGDDTDGQAVA